MNFPARSERAVTAAHGHGDRFGRIPSAAALLDHTPRDRSLWSRHPGAVGGVRVKPVTVGVPHWASSVEASTRRTTARRTRRERSSRLPHRSRCSGHRDRLARSHRAPARRAVVIADRVGARHGGAHRPIVAVRGSAEPPARRAAPPRPPRLGPAGRSLGGSTTAADRAERPGLRPAGIPPCPDGPGTPGRRSTRSSTRSSRAASAPTTRASSPASAARATRSRVLADLIGAATTRSRAAGPAARASAVELAVLDWLREWMGMPDGPRACSSAAARGDAHRARGRRARPRRRSRPGDRLRAGAHARGGRQGLADARLQPANLRVLKADPAHRLQPAAVDAALRLDREAGLRAVRGRRHGGHDEHRRGRPAQRPRRPRPPRGPVVPRRRRLRRARAADARGRATC